MHEYVDILLFVYSLRYYSESFLQENMTLMKVLTDRKYPLWPIFFFSCTFIYMLWFGAKNSLMPPVVNLWWPSGWVGSVSWDTKWNFERLGVYVSSEFKGVSFSCLSAVGGCRPWSEALVGVLGGLLKELLA